MTKVKPKYTQRSLQLYCVPLLSLYFILPSIDIILKDVSYYESAYYLRLHFHPRGAVQVIEEQVSLQMERMSSVLTITTIEMTITTQQIVKNKQLLQSDSCIFL